MPIVPWGGLSPIPNESQEFLGSALSSPWGMPRIGPQLSLKKAKSYARKALSSPQAMKIVHWGELKACI
jgi:hypothetical protein